MNNTLILLAGKYLIFVYLLPFFYYLLKGRGRIVSKAVLSTGLAIGLALFINFTFPTARPFEVWQTEPTVPVFLFEHDPDLRTSSFPSKHVSAGAAMAFSFWGQSPVLGAALMVGTLFMGTARVFALIHRWVDVLGGLFVGMLSCYLVGLLFKFFLKERT